jgi:hypothetical protein
MKKITIDLSENGLLSLGNRDLITYLKDHKFRLAPRPVAIRIAECLSPIFVWVGSSLTTKYVITEQAKQAYCNGDEKLYNDLLKL